ncbi:MAG: type II toxin-antitoxin system HicB family antitoxin [Magnetococcales bacterium]|nr:type II toxin-antitoxin system HicB family antitoxin [Magnetococcales bacterium]
MEIRHYPAIMYRGSEGMWVGFPDLPGCVSFGKTVQEAATNAEEALFGHIALMIRDGDPLPDPTSMDDLETIAPDPEDTPEVTRFLVRVEIPARWIRINLSMAETLVARIDRAAKEIGMSRSGYLAESARRMLDARS